jgi:hypothetical protein
MAGVRILSDDAMSKAMLQGLKDAFSRDLKEELMQSAEAAVDSIVDRLTRRLEIKLTKLTDPCYRTDRISLEYVLRKEPV